MTKFFNLQKTLSVVLMAVLIAVTVLCFFGCAGKHAPDFSGATVTELGQGSVTFTLNVKSESEKQTFMISTDKQTVGDALLELGIISGTKNGAWFYIESVNGITADYDKDKTYWAFYVNDAYASSGVDTTPVEDGAVYALCIEK